MRLSTALASLLCLSPLAAPTALAEGGRQISGSVTYLARIALPPEAVLLVEARNLEGASLAHQVVKIDGAQVPLDFSLEIPVSQSAVLTAAIQFGHGTRWSLDPVTIEPNDQPLDLGEQRLHAFQGIGMNAAYLCEDIRIGSRMEGDRLLIDAGVPHYPQVWDLAVAEAGKFVSADGALVASLDAESLTLAQDGTEWPACAPVPPREAANWSASGEGWSASYAEGQIALKQEGAEDVTAPLPVPNIAGHALQYALNPQGQPSLVLSVSQMRCTDEAGRTLPQTTSLQSGETNLAGCGGDPKELLTQTNWKLEAIRGDKVLADSVPTLTFTEDGLFGMASCNRYSGGYSVTETGLKFGQFISTMMACAEASMTQERAFYTALDEVTGFRFADDGALVLTNGETELLRARR